MRRDASPAQNSFERLRRRPEFVAVAKGTRANTDTFGLQTRRRASDRDEAAAGSPPRFGITVTKKVAPRAVDRNRMRRRLREALRLGAALSGAPGHDYVIVGRQPVLSIRFDDLRTALAEGLETVTRRSARRPTDMTRQGR